MDSSSADHSLDTLLDLDGQVMFIGDAGHRVQFDVSAVNPSLERPHGIKYSLTVHNAKGERIAGFDNAHAVAAAKRPGGKRIEFDHKHRFRTVRPYEYCDAGTLLADFWALAEDVLKEEGVQL
jgi:hypothetical protein